MVKGLKINKNVLNDLTKKAKDRNNLVVTAFSYLEYLLVEKV